jgi:hypothetical protein
MRWAGARERLVDLKGRVQTGAGATANGRRTGGAVGMRRGQDSQRQCVLEW